MKHGKNSPILNPYSIMIGDTNQLGTDKVTYFGVTISKGGSWNDHNHIQANATTTHNKLSFTQNNLCQCRILATRPLCGTSWSMCVVYRILTVTRTSTSPNVLMLPTLAQLCIADQMEMKTRF